LKTGGSYIQYQYWMANKHDVKRHFHIQKIWFEPRNLSPAFIYISQKLPCSELSPST
jgi:phospholipid N-methyltransferase